MNKPFDPNKPYTTRGGTVDVKISNTLFDPESRPYKYLVIRRLKGHHDESYTVYLNGRYLNNSLGEQDNAYDLVNIPVKHKIEVYFNVYKVGEKLDMLRFNTKKQADDFIGCNEYQARIACLPYEIEFTEGEGL